MPQDYAASVQGVAIRVTRLDAAGNLLNGPSDSYTTSAFIRTSFTPEYEAGDEITEKAADGTVCVSFQAPDTLKRVNLELAICDPDPELSALMSGGLMLSGSGAQGGPEQVQGWASAQVGEDPSGNGVAVEVWSRAIQNGKPANQNPYFRWVFPFVKTRLSGDRVIENGLLATTFEGFGLGNINFRSGIDKTWRWPAATDRPYLYARENWAPNGLRGFYTWDAKQPQDAANPNSWEGVGSAVGDDLTQGGLNPLVGTNVTGGANPYPYNSGVSSDFVLNQSDFTPDNSAAANFPASAASQDVNNVPPAVPAAQNPVTYLSRNDPINLDPLAGKVGDVSATLFGGAAAPANLAALQALVVDPKHDAAFGPDEYITTADGNTYSWDGANWVAYTPLGTITPAGAPSGATLGPSGTHRPANLQDLRLLGAVGQTAAWTAGQYLRLADNTEVHWDGNSWELGRVPDPNDKTSSHPLVTGAPAATLATLKKDPTIGDGAYSGPTFKAGQYIILTDKSQANYKAGVWAAGPFT